MLAAGAVAEMARRFQERFLRERAGAERHSQRTDGRKAVPAQPARAFLLAVYHW